MVTRKRLDILLVGRGLAADREQARELIRRRRVLVDGTYGAKPATLVRSDCRIELERTRSYVSRGGDKLAAALAGFAVDPAGWTCADIGCSTGGFTDCLLQQGAARVYSVDVGYGVLDWKLRRDGRVVVLERTNARYLTAGEIPEPLDLGVIDASFISLNLLLAPLAALFRNDVRIIALVKPQFELPRDKVRRGGVVRQEELHRQAVAMVEEYVREAGLRCRGVLESPVRGARGNREFLMYITGSPGALKEDQASHR